MKQAFHGRAVGVCLACSHPRQGNGAHGPMPACSSVDFADHCSWDSRELSPPCAPSALAGLAIAVIRW